MGRKMSFVFLLAALFLALPMASAFNYSVEIVDNTISPDDSAMFKVAIINDLQVPDMYTISTRDVNWLLSSEPSTAEAAPMQKVEFLVRLTPDADLREGNVYFIPVKVKSEKTGTFREEARNFPVAISTDGNMSYKCTVTPLVYIDPVIDPRKPVSVRINLRNRNAKNIEGLEVVLKGGSELNRNFPVNLTPLEEKVTGIFFNIDQYTLPGKRTLSLLLMYENTTCAETSSEYSIFGYVEMQEKSSKAPGFFKTDYVYEVYNNGNERGLASKEFEMGFFERLFSRFTPEAVNEKNLAGNTVYVVKQEIGSRETLKIYVTTDYRLLVATIALLILAAVLYFIFRSPVIVYKSAELIGKPTQEGISDVKVRIFLKNRSNGQVANVRVTDLIPTIADMKKSTHVGSMDPIGVSSGKKGTLARWEFASLEPYEERVIAYKIESKLKLVGGIRLPSAKARFEAKKGRERVTYSNSVNLVHKFDEPEMDEHPLPKRKKL